MPFLLDLNTREVYEVRMCPGSPQEWVSVDISAKRLVSMNPHDIEWEYFPSSGILNRTIDQLIVNDRDEAFDIEAYTRESKLNWTYGSPSRIKW